MFDKKYIPIAGKILTLTQNADGLWYDTFGTVWALRDEKASIDHTDRCGVGIFSLPKNHPLNKACITHDYFFESPAYQYFNTRLAADKWLLMELEKYGKGWSFLSRPFYWLSRAFGGAFWEQEKTR